MKEEDKIWKTRIDAIIVKKRKYRDPDFSASKLAEELGVSVFQLSRIFKKVYGKPYSDIVLPLRLKLAKKYMLSSSKARYTVEEIGLSVGFMNKWSFFQAFRKYEGMTPGEWKSERMASG